MIEDNWLEAAYNDAFASIYNNLKNRSKSDLHFKIDDIKAELETEYVQQGNAWAGRGEVEEVKINATIAAYEQFLSELTG